MYKPRLTILLPPPPQLSASLPTPPLPARPARAVREVPDQTLTAFERGGDAYELWVPYLEETIWFVPTADMIPQLAKEGVRRGRIWTAGELRDFASIETISRQDVERIVRVKAAFGAEIVDVVPDEIAEQKNGDA